MNIGLDGVIHPVSPKHLTLADTVRGVDTSAQVTAGRRARHCLSLARAERGRRYCVVARKAQQETVQTINTEGMERN